MCKFPLMDCLQIICKNFFAKLVQFVFLCHRLSKKLNFIKIWQLKVGQNKDLVCNRKKQSFRQLVKKSGFRPWVFRKSQKISTASDQYFSSYVKKTTGGVKLTPPRRNRVKQTNSSIRTTPLHLPYLIKATLGSERLKHFYN